MESMNIAVIGFTGVGKSHFIQRAMSLPRTPGAQPTSARITIDHIPYAVTLWELDLEYFDVDPERRIQWPKQIGGAMVSSVHGVLLLYDVMNRDSIAELPQTLTALVKSSLPTVLVATKCDNPEDARQINTEAVGVACESCIASFKTSSSKPESARLPLSTLLRAVIANRLAEEAAEGPGHRRRAASAAHLDTPETMTRPLSQGSKHSRASSDMSFVRNYSPQPAHGRGYSQDGREDHPAPTVSSMLRSPGTRIDRQNQAAFVEIEESDGESFKLPEDIPILQRNTELTFDRPASKKAAGSSFDELVDRLIAPKLSRADTNFTEIFLCLYRKFATPEELFSGIVSRLERVKADKSEHYLSKTSMQLRIIEIVAKWVTSYPSDFAHTALRRDLEDFVRHLSSEPIFAAAAQQMRRTLDTAHIVCDDVGWVQTEGIEDEMAESSASSMKEATKISTADLNESISSMSVEDSIGTGPSISTGRRPSQSSSLNEIGVPGKVHQFQYHSYEDYDREAATMIPSYTMPLTKFRYHIFMDTADDDIADEITRIDWVMFSSIRIRDFIRHVTLNMKQKEKCKSMQNVNRMISHFNHIAKWVANMILMRDKAKHRAQMLEKFMLVALKLRVLNNYNGLAAVLAGINGTAIHRLAQTRGLVPADVQKRFARLVLLMGTQKSHFAYRLAWENSPLPRIPFMPLHRRDLVSAEEGSMTFVGPDGDRINWKKFEVLGEILLPVMRSQGAPYPNLARHDIARELILDCLMPTDEEDIYQRSVAVESTNSAAAVDPAKKKFPWFAKQ